MAIMSLAYFLMQFTFVALFMNMRKIGSRFSLGVTTLVCGALALCSSLVVTHLLGVEINFIQITYVFFFESFLNLCTYIHIYIMTHTFIFILDTHTFILSHLYIRINDIKVRESRFW